MSALRRSSWGRSTAARSSKVAPSLRGLPKLSRLKVAMRMGLDRCLQGLHRERLLDWHEGKMQSRGHCTMGDHADMDIEAVGQVWIFGERAL